MPIIYKLGFIRNFLHLLDGKFELLNMLLLFTISLFLVSSLKNKIGRMVASFFTGLFLVLELASLYATKSFIDYQFYVHFNTRDLMAMAEFFVFQFTCSVIFLLLLIMVLYWSKAISQKVFQILGRIFPGSERFFSRGIIQITKIFIVALSVTVMSLNKGIINTGYELFKVLNVDKENFHEALAKAGMTDYVMPDDLEAVKGKNIIVISLESLERGYLSDTTLTPNLCSLKNKWNYFDMKQNLGSGWSSASLYTYLTGIPAFFGVERNSIFQTAYHSNITGISHVLKKAGYNMTYIASDAESFGEEEILHTMQIHRILDKTSFGKHARDKDIFENAKLEIQSDLSQNQPFALFISTLDTHFPDGIYDKRMEKYVPPQNSKLKFSVSAADYLLGDFIKYLKEKGILSNTVVYIFPDHLKMGDTHIFDGTGGRGLYLLTNADQDRLHLSNDGTLYQIDLPGIILKGANIKHNAKFLTDYISGDKDAFIKENIVNLVSLNLCGLLRLDSKPLIPTLSKKYEEYKNDTNRYIAHAGGEINGHIYTNSLEALNASYEKGFRLFELDIAKTKDGKYIASHDWGTWAACTNYEGNCPVTNEEFLKHKFYDNLTPLDMDKINSWFSQHKDAILVTDKINEPKHFSEMFVDKKRLMMELFSLDAVKEGMEAKIKSAMPSQNVINLLTGDKIEILKQLGIKNIVISRREIAGNLELLKELKENGIKTYVYNLNLDAGMDEEYVTKYEMDYIYGMYADSWSFHK
jgi:glycerophosphoryl diester phosphodiesterase